MTRQNLRAGRDATSVGRDLILNVGTNGGWLLAAALVGSRVFPHTSTPVAVESMKPATGVGVPTVDPQVSSIPPVSSNPGTQVAGGVAAAQLAAPVAMPSQSSPEFSGSPVAVSRSAAPNVSQQVVTQSFPVAVPRPAAAAAVNQQVVTQSSGGGATNITTVSGNKARNIVTGTNGSVTINESPGPQSMILQTKAIETLENRVGKTVVSAVEKVAVKWSAETKAAIADASEQALNEPQVIAQPSAVANADAVPVLERNTKSYRPLAGVTAGLAGATTANSNSWPVSPRTALVPDDETPPLPAEPRYEEPPPAPPEAPEEPEEPMVKSLESQTPDDPSIQGIEELPSDSIETEPPSALDEQSSDLIEREPPSALEEQPSELIDPDTGDITESEAVSQPENQSAGITEGWVPAADERSSSEVPPRYKRVINPVHGVV
jgi:hypothetical protein